MRKRMENVIIPFIVGGTVISTVKFVATNLDNPGLAAVLGGIPTGLLSIYFLSKNESVEYAHNYLYVTLILASSIVFFYTMNTNTGISKNIILAMSFGMWGLLVGLHYAFRKNLP